METRHVYPYPQHILPLAAIADVSDDIIHGMFLRILFLIFAMPWLVIAFSMVSYRSVR